MAVRVTDPETQRDRARAMWDLHQEWSGEQIAAGVDGPVPDGRKAGSDYNQHVPDLEASGEAMDSFHDRARALHGLPPLK